MSLQDIPTHTPTIGIALGAGGANGLAHIPMLEVLDEMNITPTCISGSSVGAVIGALYASGLSGKEIRATVNRFISLDEEPITTNILTPDSIRWLRFIEPGLGKGGLISSDGFISYLSEIIDYKAFEDLPIPLKVVAADQWSCEQIVLEKGKLLPAIKASMALPGIFEAVSFNNRMLIDGGTVNPLPYDILAEKCDIVIAINVASQRTASKTAIPSYFDTIFNASRVMQSAIVKEKLKHQPPTIYISPKIVDVRALEFYRAKQIFEQAEPSKEQLRQALQSHMAKATQ